MTLIFNVCSSVCILLLWSFLFLDDRTNPVLKCLLMVGVIKYMFIYINTRVLFMQSDEDVVKNYKEIFGENDPKS